MNHRKTVIYLFAILSLFLLVAGTTSATEHNEGFDLSVQGDIDTPSETVEFEGENYILDSVAQRESGESITVQVTVPDPDGFYNLYLYNNNGDTMDFRRPVSNGSYTFDTGYLDPGSYLFIIEDHLHRKIYPLVIKGYNVTVQHPDSVNVSENFSIDVYVEPGEITSDPNKVEIGVWSDVEKRRITASYKEGDRYSANISLESVDNYSIYAGALGDENLWDTNEKEGLAVSQRSTLSVTEEEDKSSDSTNNTTNGTENNTTTGNNTGNTENDSSQTDNFNDEESQNDETDSTNENNTLSGTNESQNNTTQTLNNTTESDLNESTNVTQNTTEINDGNQSSNNTDNNENNSKNGVIQPSNPDNKSSQNDSGNNDSGGSGIDLGWIAVALLILVISAVIIKR